MPHRASRTARANASLALGILLLLAGPSGCATSGTSSSSGGGSNPVTDAELGALPETGIKAGWMQFKSPTKTGQMTSLTLISESSKEGQLIAKGRARMDGGKVISDRDALALAASFDQEGFGRFAVKVNPNEAPTGALGAVWIDRGNGYESIFLLPGQRQNPATRDIPDVYFHLKGLILSVHQTTPGSSVRVGEGWSGEELLDQKPGDVSK